MGLSVGPPLFSSLPTSHLASLLGISLGTRNSEGAEWNSVALVALVAWLPGYLLIYPLGYLLFLLTCSLLTCSL